MCPLTKEKTYVVGIAGELFDVLSVCVFANKFNDSTACLSQCRTSIGKSRVRLPGVDACSMQVLEEIRK